MEDDDDDDDDDDDEDDDDDDDTLSPGVIFTADADVANSVAIATDNDRGGDIGGWSSSA